MVHTTNMEHDDYEQESMSGEDDFGDWHDDEDGQEVEHCSDCDDGCQSMDGPSNESFLDDLSSQDAVDLCDFNDYAVVDYDDDYVNEGHTLKNSNNYQHFNEVQERESIHQEKRNETHKNRQHVIVWSLSIILALLVVNFGYQLMLFYETSTSQYSSTLSHEKSNYENKNNVATDVKINNRGNKLKPIINVNNQHGNQKQGHSTQQAFNYNKINNDDEEEKYQPYPPRIYTHSSLSSKNYRAGGILSEEMLQRYEKDGVVVIRNLISPKLLERLDKASKLLIAREEEERSGKEKKGRRGKKGKQFHMVKNGAIFLGVPRRQLNVGSRGEETCAANTFTNSTLDTNESSESINTILSSFRDLAMYSKIPRVAASLLRLDELRVGGEKNLIPRSSRSRKKRGRRNKEIEAAQRRGERTQGEATNDEEGLEFDDSVNLRICR